VPNDIVTYRRGYRYQLVEPYEVLLPIHPPKDMADDYLDLTTEGRLTILKGYAWDGPSGPTIDTTSSIRGSLIHDALYQLMREHKLGPEYRSVADALLYQYLVDDGMLRARALIWYQAVRWGAGPSARPSGGRPVLMAP